MSMLLSERKENTQEATVKPGKLRTRSTPPQSHWIQTEPPLQTAASASFNT